MNILPIPTGTWTEAYFRARTTISDTGCWLWQQHIDREGYGRIGLSAGGQYGAHRISYELWRGPIPDGLVIDHLCRVRHCVNPAHLEPVTAKENVLRGESMAAANARKTHCKHGHEFTQANTYVWRGGRYCRTCNRAAVARAKARRNRRKSVGR